MMSYQIPKGKAKFILGIDSTKQLEGWLKETENIVGLAFVGRSNVGKSSTINTLFGKKTARTSNTPGRTRQINIFEFRLDGFEEDESPLFYLFDLPGYGHAQVSKAMSKNWRELMNIFFKYLSKDMAICNIQDARHPNQKSDQAFHQFIKAFPNQTFLVLNKIDKLKKQKERAALKKMLPELLVDYKWVKQFFMTSAESKQGIDGLHDALVSFLLDRVPSELLKVDEVENSNEADDKEKED